MGSSQLEHQRRPEPFCRVWEAFGNSALEVRETGIRRHSTSKASLSWSNSSGRWPVQVKTLTTRATIKRSPDSF